MWNAPPKSKIRVHSNVFVESSRINGAVCRGLKRWGPANSDLSSWIIEADRLWASALSESENEARRIIWYRTICHSPGGPIATRLSQTPDHNLQELAYRGPRFIILGRDCNRFQCSSRNRVHCNPADYHLRHIFPLLCPPSPNSQPLTGRRSITPGCGEFSLHNTNPAGPSSSRDPVHLLKHR